MKKDYGKMLAAYHKAVELTIKFADWINSHTSYKCEVYYQFGYWSYFKYTDINQASIKLLKVPFMNNCLRIASMVCENEKPFIFSCWYYAKKDAGIDGHHFSEFENFADLNESDFPLLWDMASKFYGFDVVRYRQMSLFDFVGC